MPFAPQASINAGEAWIAPNATIEASMWKGTRERSSPSTLATRFSPSLRSAAPSDVT